MPMLSFCEPSFPVRPWTPRRCSLPQRISSSKPALMATSRPGRAIVRQYRRRLFNVAYKFVGRYDEAEDLTQEIFLKVFRVLNTFDRRANFQTWLISISRNLCIDHYRRSAIWPPASAAPGYGARSSCSATAGSCAGAQIRTPNDSSATAARTRWLTCGWARRYRRCGATSTVAVRLSAATAPSSSRWTTARIPQHSRDVPPLPSRLFIDCTAECNTRVDEAPPSLGPLPSRLFIDCTAECNTRVSRHAALPRPA